MKKFLVLFFCLMFFVSFSYGEEIKMKILVKSVDIISPDGEKTTYDDVLKIPKIEYASKIISSGMGILTCCYVAIILKSQQGLFFAKNPITNAVEISKVENSAKGSLTLSFDPDTFANVSPDGKISLKYEEEKDRVTMEVLNGNALMKVGDLSFELPAGESFHHELRGRRNAF